MLCTKLLWQTYHRLHPTWVCWIIMCTKMQTLQLTPHSTFHVFVTIKNIMFLIKCKHFLSSPMKSISLCLQATWASTKSHCSSQTLPQVSPTHTSSLPEYLSLFGPENLKSPSVHTPPSLQWNEPKNKRRQKEMGGRNEQDIREEERRRTNGGEGRKGEREGEREREKMAKK